MMLRSSVLARGAPLGLLLSLVACSEGENSDPNASGATFGDTSAGESEGGEVGEVGDEVGSDTGDGDGDTDTGDGDGDGDMCDATPWSGIWVGDPCELDSDCSFPGG